MVLDIHEKLLFLKVRPGVCGASRSFFWQSAGSFSAGFCREKRDSAGASRSRKSGVFSLHSLIGSKSWRVKDPLLSVTTGL